MSITLWQSLTNESERLARCAFQDVGSFEEWRAVRPSRHRELMRSLGLDPLPPRCDLKLNETARVGGDGFALRNVAFQIMPDCWTSAAIFYPDPLPSPDCRLPGVLYVCGHASIGVLAYQGHAIMWARRGYVCLVVDTIEQHDNLGEHHDHFVGSTAAWQSLGYSSAGGETWNSLRALDVLEDDPHVDSDRIGVTGQSGGGACSFYVAMIDPRIKACSSLCGVSTPYDAIGNRHVDGHCSCLFPPNLFRRDTSEYAALIAPRAALFCFAEHDPLFHPQEVQAFVERTRHVFDLQGVGDRCRIVMCPGAHGSHPEFDEATARWFDQHVAGESRPAVCRGTVELTETTASVFHGQPPQPNRLDQLPHLLSQRGTVPLPQSPDQWPHIRQHAINALRQDVFIHGSDVDIQSQLSETGHWQRSDGTVLRAYRGQIEGVSVWLQSVSPLKARPQLVLSIAGEGETWKHAIGRVGVMLGGAVCFAGFEPRMSQGHPPGLHECPGSTSVEIESVRTTQHRAMAILGTTPVAMTLRDLDVVLRFLRSQPSFKDHEVYLYGRGEAGVAALYRGVLDESIAGVIAQSIPSSHLSGAPILGVLRHMDLPHAVGLIAPRKVALVEAGHRHWTWPARAFGRLGCPQHFIRSDDLRDAIDRILPSP